MERKLAFEPGEYYHVYNRGVDKREIFRERADWYRFQQVLYLCNSHAKISFREILFKGLPFEYNRGDPLVAVLLYAQMPNHFHLVMRETEGGGISKYMSKAMTAYSMYFNTKYERSGPLLNKPFRAKHIDSDEYFRWVCSYVHLNPLDLFDVHWKESGLTDTRAAADFLKSYEYSSYTDYVPDMAPRPERAILTPDASPFPISELLSMDSLMGELSSYPTKGYPL